MKNIVLILLRWASAFAVLQAANWNGFDGTQSAIAMVGLLVFGITIVIDD